MCGIFGLVAGPQSELNEESFKLAATKLLRFSQSRGCEAAGLAVACDNEISIYKQAMKPSKLIRTAGFSKLIASTISKADPSCSGRLSLPIALIGHTRLVTNGSQAIPENNQPINEDHVVGVHNGIITNDRELLIRYPELRKSSDVYLDSDTRVLLRLINKYYSASQDIAKAIKECFKEITGSASIALFCDDLQALVLATNTGSLYYTFLREEGFFVFGSEEYIIKQFLKKTALAQKQDLQIKSLSPLNGVFVRFEDVTPEVFSLKEMPDRVEYFLSSAKKSLYKIIDHSLPKKELRRCVRCVLPESYPFITFDESGVCNYCRKYEKQKFKGREVLEAILENYRSKDGGPDCIVGFSGGRDSSYGLHLLKVELGMHPIAFTYDWALVTDLARRNQARVTGKLGVEHIIRAADIHTKRRYIRKNIYAWLKRPELGIVPLFMAGDKMFYYYGRKLRKETGIRLTVFAAGHQLEQMEFKVGFCGIDQNLINNTKLYHYNSMVKLRLAMWYVKQYILNPTYINESLIDNIFAFYSSFINKDDYLYLYRYVPWDEKLIERTLKEEYGWESDEKYGTNQWRMGDAHTAFIDYIYYTIAGFSEFDNFRSNQIREGLITREKALELLQEDNRPRIAMLQDFSQLIGFNLEEVLLRINSIPRLY